MLDEEMCKRGDNI